MIEGGCRVVSALDGVVGSYRGCIPVVGGDFSPYGTTSGRKQLLGQQLELEGTEERNTERVSSNSECQLILVIIVKIGFL